MASIPSKLKFSPTGTGLDQLIDYAQSDIGLLGNISDPDLLNGLQAAAAMNQIIVDAVKATGVAADGQFSGQDVLTLNQHIRTHHRKQWSKLHGDDEGDEETGFHLVQNDGATTSYRGDNLVNTVMDGIYHLGFKVKGYKLLNEDGDGNATIFQVADWLTQLWQDHSTTGTPLDRLTDRISSDPGLGYRLSEFEINDGADAADRMNALLMKAIDATGALKNGPIEISDIRAINSYLRTHHRKEWNKLHGDDEDDGTETGYHLVQNDGAWSSLFGQNAVNTIIDGIYHLGYRIQGQNVLNEDGDPNASLSDLADWLNYFLYDPGNTGTGLDQLVDAIKNEQSLAERTSAADINAGAEAANGLNGIIAEAIRKTGVAKDQLIDTDDIKTLNGYIRKHHLSQWTKLHGDDESDGSETGFHQVQNDGARAKYRGENFIDTVIDGLYHLGFQIKGDEVLNEDGDPNANLGELATWLNNFYLGKENTFGSQESDRIESLNIDTQVWARGGDDRVSTGSGRDRIDGGSGNDSLGAGAGRDVVIGGSGNDRLYGEEGVDRLFGGDGDDYLDGGTGKDRLKAGDGNDYLHGREHNDLVYGENGNDKLYGDEGDDRLYGGGGNDYLVGGYGKDRLFGNADDDQLFGEDGEDLLLGGDGNDKLYGQEGNDTLLGGDGNDYLNGGTGDDKLDAGDGDNQLNGDAGNDQITSGSGKDNVYAGDGNDRVTTGSGNDSVDGGTGNDVLNTGGGDDYLRGRDGNDRLTAGAGNDRLYGDEARDKLDGGSGNDTLDGGTGNDRLIGDEGDDYLRGQDGDDQLLAGDGNDRLYGDAGKDELLGGEGNDYLDGGSGDDQLDADKGDDQLHGQEGNDRLLAGSGKDKLYGDDGDDRLYGGGGDDYLHGGNGDDVLVAGAGADKLIGYYGDDRLNSESDNADDELWGNSGADRFVFDVRGPGIGEDTIRDFSLTEGDQLVIGGPDVNFELSQLSSSSTRISLTDSAKNDLGSIIVYGAIDNDDITLNSGQAAEIA